MLRIFCSQCQKTIDSEPGKDGEIVSLCMDCRAELLQELPRRYARRTRDEETIAQRGFTAFQTTEATTNV